MSDPDFDDPKSPPCPLVSTAAVACVCSAAVACAFLAFASVQPDAAVEIGKGAALVVGGLTVPVFILFMVWSAS